MDKKNRTAFVTGTAGFIGFHVANLLMKHGWKVIGLDCISDYYDVKLKLRRHKILSNENNFTKIEGFLEHEDLVEKICMEQKPDIIIHLAAQAGVRYSINNPEAYVTSNLVGTSKVLEAARKAQVSHLLLASTSSVYGSNLDMPFTESQKSDSQMSFYAATKKSNEVMSHAYSHLFKIPTTVFRFFTVYGPWGRPDMALYKFAEAILKDKAIEVYNYGNMKRDFTYVADIAESIRLLVDVFPDDPNERNKTFPDDSLSNVAPWRVVNIGNSKPVSLTKYISALEKAIGKTAKKKFLPMQAGDVKDTFANTDLLFALTKFKPRIGVNEGVFEFVKWYLEYKEENL